MVSQSDFESADSGAVPETRRDGTSTANSRGRPTTEQARGKISEVRAGTDLVEIGGTLTARTTATVFARH